MFICISQRRVSVISLNESTTQLLSANQNLFNKKFVNLKPFNSRRPKPRYNHFIEFLQKYNLDLVSIKKKKKIECKNNYQGTKIPLLLITNLRVMAL